MKTKFLVSAVACVSIAAGAQQSDKKKDQPASHEVKAPRDVATGQASGRKMNQTEEDSAASASHARETATGQATGKTMAHDDWSPRSNTAKSGDPHVQNVSAPSGGDQAEVRESPSKTSTGLRESPSKASTGKTSRVATGDVNGDGTPDKAAASSDGVKSPRDLATGQASGKRQHGTTPDQSTSTPKK